MDGALMVTRTWAQAGGWEMRGRPRIPARVPRQAGEVRRRRRRSGRGRATVKVLADEGLEGAEVALGEVLEAASRRRDGGLGGIEPGHGAEQVLVVLAELELDGPGELRVAGEVQGGAGPIPPGLHQRAKAQSLEPLGDRAPVPSELSRGRLHVEAVAPQAGVDGGVAGDLRGEQRHVVGPGAEGRQPEHETLEAEPQVLPEPALRDATLEVAVARGDHAHVHARRPCRPDLVEDLFLEDAQQLALLVGAQLADLV